MLKSELRMLLVGYLVENRFDFDSRIRGGSLFVEIHFVQIAPDSFWKHWPDVLTFFNRAPDKGRRQLHDGGLHQVDMWVIQ